MDNLGKQVLIWDLSCLSGLSQMEFLFWKSIFCCLFWFFCLLLRMFF